MVRNYFVSQDWFMTMETSYCVGPGSWQERFDFLSECSQQQLSNQSLLPISDKMLQEQSVCTYMEELVNIGAVDDVMLKDIGHDVNIFPPIVLGLGYSKLRHKMAALLHQFRLEVGNDMQLLKKYTRSVISVCSDQGTEAGLFAVPDVDIALHLRNEAQALTQDCGDAAEVLFQLQIPDGIDEAATSDAQETMLSRSTNDLQAAASLVNRMFPNCIFFPGIKHSMDNCLCDCWSALRAKESFLKQLSAIEYLMKQPTLRSKLAYLFFGQSNMFDKTYSHLLKHWGPTLKSLRWHAVIEFLQSLLQLEDGLRKKWNLAQWLKAIPGDRQEQAGEGRVQPSTSYKLMDQAIHSNYFWKYARMLIHISKASETLSHWAEGCWYHRDNCTQASCAFKGARAPELASGAHKWLLKQFQKSAELSLSTLAASLTHSEAQDLAADYHTATSRLMMEWEFRLHFWDLLPWKLCGLAVPNLEMAQVNAQLVLTMWKKMSPTQQRCSHPVTRRFLDPEWGGQTGQTLRDSIQSDIQKIKKSIPNTNTNTFQSTSL